MDKQSRFLADILTSHIYTVMSMFVSFEEQFEKICSGPLFCCSKIKLRQVAKNKVPHIRDILPEVFLILQQVSYEHLKKWPALLALILPLACASESICSSDLCFDEQIYQTPL